MTLEERAGKVIAQIVGADAAVQVISALLSESIYFKESSRSTKMSTRFHSHCDFIARHSDGQYTKDEIYSRALNKAVQRGLYPYTVVTQSVTINSAVFDVEVTIPASTTTASNRELSAAYAVLEEQAAQLGVVLPERKDYV